MMSVCYQMVRGRWGLSKISDISEGFSTLVVWFIPGSENHRQPSQYQPSVQEQHTDRRRCQSVTQWSIHLYSCQRGWCRHSNGTAQSCRWEVWTQGCPVEAWHHRHKLILRRFSPDRPYLRIYLQPQANANTRTIQVNGTLIANVSSSSIEGSWDMIANMSANGTDANEVSTANVSSRVESYVDEDVTLSFAMEAYPPITNHRWVTPMAVKAEYQQSYTVNGYRWPFYWPHLSMLLATGYEWSG